MLRFIALLFSVFFAATPIYAADDVTYTGEFLSGRVAIGGETSGFALRYRAADGATTTIDLDVKPEVARQFKSGTRVRVTGTLQQREYVERGKVDVLVVKEMVAATD
jgi:hypothetical protein